MDIEERRLWKYSNGKMKIWGLKAPEEADSKVSQCQKCSGNIWKVSGCVKSIVGATTLWLSGSFTGFKVQEQKM